jgi:hypothetical protein
MLPSAEAAPGYKVWGLPLRERADLGCLPEGGAARRRLRRHIQLYNSLKTQILQGLPGSDNRGKFCHG